MPDDAVVERLAAYAKLIEDIDYSVRFVATGNTYPHREKFQSYAWHWDAERQAWCYEVHGEPFDEDLCVIVPMGWPGVRITVEALDNGE